MRCSYSMAQGEVHGQRLLPVGRGTDVCISVCARSLKGRVLLGREPHDRGISYHCARALPGVLFKNGLGSSLCLNPVLRNGARSWADKAFGHRPAYLWLCPAPCASQWENFKC